MKHRTEQYLNMKLPEDYGSCIRNPSMNISRHDALIICRALSRLYQSFKIRYPGISLEDKLLVENDYHKRLRKVINFQQNKFTFFPYFYFDFLYRLKRKLLNVFL
jgi:hypothetical protein